jgi:CubicO group peptidase (beta-lactamase class C family)
MRKYFRYGIAAAAMFGIARADVIDDIAQKTMKEVPVAGFSIGVMRSGHAVALRGYGDAKADTVFHIASVSKNIAAAAVLLLADQGKLRLDGIRWRNTCRR